MLATLLPNLWFRAAIVAAVFGAGFFSGHKISAWQSSSELAAKDRNFSAYKEASDRSLIDAKNKLAETEAKKTEELARVDKNANDLYVASKEKYDRIVARLNLDSLRVLGLNEVCAGTVSTNSKTATTAGEVGSGQASELLQSLMVDLNEIARDCDRDVLERNEIKARYNALGL